MRGWGGGGVRVLAFAVPAFLTVCLGSFESYTPYWLFGVVRAAWIFFKGLGHL